MPSPSRHRSRSPESDRERRSKRRKERSMSRSRSRSPQRDLPHHASPITESEYFQRSNEFRVWLRDEKGKYFDELSGDRARSYFRKFVKAWNRGKLSKHLYAGIENSELPATSQTSYKWSFASKATRAEGEALKQTREAVGAATHNRLDQPSSSASTSRGRMLGPALPSSSDRQLAREAEEESRDDERRYKRKRDKMDAKDRIEDMVGQKETGREGMLEKKRVKRDNDRAFREKGDEGLEADESTLMGAGGGDSFQAQIARRDAAKKRAESRREEQNYAVRERADALKAKESATMAMFQEMARQRFG